MNPQEQNETKQAPLSAASNTGRRIGRGLYMFRGLIPIPLMAVVVLYARPSEIAFLAGVAVALLGETGRLWALTYIGPKSRAEGKRRADRLITEGPYALTRNPLYVANLTIAAGVLIAANRWILLFAIPLGFLYYTLVAMAEEEFLQSAFPSQWPAYARQVPRFFPRVRRPDAATERFRLSECLTPELSTIIAAEVALGLIGLKIFTGFYGFGGSAFPLFP
ncbi:MAG: methyltransferase family protein [Planctomycetota bacterium]